jgi:hypothetical protein
MPSKRILSLLNTKILSTITFLLGHHSHYTLLPRWPDWAKIRPMGDCCLCTVVHLYTVHTKYPTFLGYFIPRSRCCINFAMCWATFWLTFRKLIWSPYKVSTYITPQFFAARVARWFVLKQKIPIWVKFGGHWNGKCCYILWPFGIFYGNLVEFLAFRYSLW